MRLTCPDDACPSNIGGKQPLFRGTVEVDENGEVTVEAEDHEDGYVCAHCDIAVVEADEEGSDFRDSDDD